MFKTLKKLTKVGTFSSNSLSSIDSSTNDAKFPSSPYFSPNQSKKAKFHVIALHNYMPVNEDTDLALEEGKEYEILDSSGVWWMARNAQGQIGLVPHNYIEIITNESTPLDKLSEHGTSRHGFGDNHSSPSNNYHRCKFDMEDELMEIESTYCDSETEMLKTTSLMPSTASEYHGRHQTRQNNNAAKNMNTSLIAHSLFETDFNSLSLFQHYWYFSIDRETAELLLKQKCNGDGTFLVRPSTTENNCFTLSMLVKKNRFAEVKHYLIHQAKSKSLSSSFPHVYYLRPQEKFFSIEKLIEYYQQNRGHLVSQLVQVPCRANFIWQQSLMIKSPNDAKYHQRHHSYNNNVSGSSNGRFVDLAKDKYWEIKVSELQLLEELGSGQFGVVRHGKWKGKFDVAVKLMKEGTMSEKEFIEEAEVMTKLKHTNLVKLYGVCIEHRPICIVAEFMKHGSLLLFLRKNEQKILNSSQKVRFLLNMCIQVASGMAYLESRNYIHRDLAARNCLVGNSNVVKVADFGLTRYVIDDEYTSSSGTKFPIRWAPPEVLWYRRFSSKSDVWAYGILVWEIFSLGKLPYGKLTNAEVVEKIHEGHRLDKPKQCPLEIFHLMKNCWQEIPEKRLSFRQIELCLIGLKDRDLHKQLNINNFSDGSRGDIRPTSIDHLARNNNHQH